MSYRNSQRVEKIKRKFGTTIFRTWGMRGGNPVLIAQGRGDKIIIQRRSR